MGSIWRKFLHAIDPGRFEAELNEELRLHRELLVEESGHARDFGNTTLALEHSREQWSFRWVESLGLDLRYALRGLRRSPMFALTVIGTIGAALGLNTTLFTVFNAYVLRPVAVRDPYGLWEFRWIQKESGRGRLSSWAEYADMRDSKIGFSESVAYTNLTARVNGFSLFGHLVTGNHFTMLGVGTALGRVIVPSDLEGDADPAVIVLSYPGWKNKLGGDPNIVGSKLIIHGHPLQVIGVTSKEFLGIDSSPPDFWIPLSMAPQITPADNLFGSAQPRSLFIIGRVRQDSNVSAAQAELNVWARRVTAGRTDQRASGAQLVSRATMIPPNREVLALFTPILAAFVLVLVIACANVANMMLARGLARHREIGIRLSLGAARSRLIRQLLTESAMLAIPSALAGFALARGTIGIAQRALFATMPPEFLRYINMVDLTPDWRVFSFLLAAALLATLAFGLAPAIQATRRGLVQASRGDFSADLRPARLRSALVVSQVTVCALLLIVAGVLLRSGAKVASRDPRLDVTGVLDIRLPSQFKQKGAEALRAMPWVENVAAAWRGPLYGSNWSMPIIPSGSHDRLWAAYNFVSPEYFALYRVPILRGRNFTTAEARGEAGVALISEATAARLWPGQDPLAQSVEVQTTGPKFGRVPRERSARVIGVTRDVISGWLGDGIDGTMIYFPSAESNTEMGSMLIRLRGDFEKQRLATETELNRILAGAADQINPMDQVLAVQIYPFRIAGWIASILGGLALLLTISGIYGVLSYVVGQRTKEIGIRMAMGASARGIVRFVLVHTMRLTVAGLAIGIALALGVSKLVASALTAINAFDLLAYSGGFALVFAAALIASFFPVRRAVKVDPVTALRCD